MAGPGGRGRSEREEAADRKEVESRERRSDLNKAATE